MKNLRKTASSAMNLAYQPWTATVKVDWEMVLFTLVQCEYSVQVFTDLIAGDGFAC
jgi:hypothetical protein